MNSAHLRVALRDRDRHLSAPLPRTQRAATYDGRRAAQPADAGEIRPRRRTHSVHSTPWRTVQVRLQPSRAAFAQRRNGSKIVEFWRVLYAARLHGGQRWSFCYLHHSLLRESAARGHALYASNTMGSGSATNDLTSPSSASSPRFNEPEALSFERPTLQVGRYRILSELGRGGMSNVFLAVASGPGGVNKLVVLKALLPDLATEGYALSMFMDEARLAAQLNHPNVVQTYEVGTEGDRHVIVMEYLEGQSLSATTRRAAAEGAALPLALHLRIISSALDGLHYAHELSGYEGASLQLVHRDISPQNVFVTYDGQVKVLDFGIAKATSASTHTAAGVMKGKIAYMAPEQIVGGAVDRRADLFSVGCMLWAAATGVKLWKDTPDVQIMRRAISGDIPTPQSVNPECDDDLNAIVMKALAREPEDRYATAIELQHDLEVYVERFGAAAKQKEIARFVSTLFADTRAQLKALVERQLTLIQTDNSSVSRERPRPAGRGSNTLGGATSESVHTLLAEPIEPGRGKRRLIAGFAVLALLGAVSFYGWGHGGARLCCCCRACTRVGGPASESSGSKALLGRRAVARESDDQAVFCRRQ